MNKKNIIIAVIVLAVVVVGYYVFIKPSPISEISESVDTSAPQAKIDINAVCEGTLAYKTFTDGASADAFVAECKEGKHPEVMEEFKKQMNLGDGVAI